MAADERTVTVTMDEVKQHNKADSVWIVIRGNVYDVTKFLDEHPGGRYEILDRAGEDVTKVFDYVLHSSDAQQLLKKFFIGKLR